MMRPSESDNGRAGPRAHPFAPLSPAELDDLWDVDLLAEEQGTLDAAFAADPPLRGELAPILRALDYERRHFFVSALVAIHERAQRSVDLAAAVREALDSTRHAAFIAAIVDQERA